MNKRKVAFICSIAFLAIQLAAALAISNTDNYRYRKQMILGQKYLKQMEYENAVVAFEMAISIKPNDKEAMRSLIQSNALAGQQQEMVEWLNEYLFDSDEDEVQLALLNELAIKKSEFQKQEEERWQGVLERERIAEEAESASVVVDETEQENSEQESTENSISEPIVEEVKNEYVDFYNNEYGTLTGIVVVAQGESGLGELYDYYELKFEHPYDLNMECDMVGGSIECLYENRYKIPLAGEFDVSPYVGMCVKLTGTAFDSGHGFDDSLRFLPEVVEILE